MHCSCPHSVHHEEIVLVFLGTIRLVPFGVIDGVFVNVQVVEVRFFGVSVWDGRVDYGPDEARTGGVIWPMSAEKIEGGLEGI